ncbi:MAG: hypothetical protein C4530_02520 [Desulfobacteraceae bacterium]|nr:MAG: hypothetical protein C4530_02520 [Desulfobacteraceae bacterium]
MKKLLMTFLIVVCLLRPSICTSSYIIRLTSGAEFVASGYWEEEKQIKFYAYGGVIGVEKQLVAGISETDRPVVTEYQESVDGKSASEPFEINPERLDDKAQLPSLDPHGQIFLQEKKRLASAMETAVSAFRAAKEQNDRAVMAAKRKQILELKAELSDIESEVKKNYGGKVPDWWYSGKPPPSD